MSSTKKIKLKRETPAVDFSLLPDVVMIEIFSYLDYYDLCRCARMCRTWHSIAQSRRLKKAITVKRYLSVWQLKKLVECHFHEGLEMFELEGDEFDRIHVSFETLTEMKVKSPHVKKMVFKWCNLYPSVIDDMPSKIRHLCLHECIVSEYIKSDIYMKVQKDYLTCLDITGRGITLPLKFFYASKLKNLQLLYLENCGNVSNRRIRSMVDILPQLCVLDIEGNMVKNGGVRLILEHCTAIEELYIGHLHVDDGAFFNCSVSRLPNLITLCIAGTYITPHGLRKFIRGSMKEVSIFGQDDLLPGPMSALLQHRHNFDGCNHYLSHSCPS